jgi:hypothetical protein
VIQCILFSYATAVILPKFIENQKIKLNSVVVMVVGSVI